MSDIEIQLAKALADASSYAVPTPAGLTGHDVLFYRTDAFLTRTVVDFLAEGVGTGHPIIVIATEAHRRTFVEGLRAKGVDPHQGFGDRLPVWLDARETLETLMDGSLPSRELFMAIVVDAFERVIDERNHLVIRCYGEMVDLLWKDGNPEGASLLEQYTNELANQHKFAMLCGYAIDDFMHEEGIAEVRRICDQHKHVLPLESIKRSA